MYAKFSRSENLPSEMRVNPSANKHFASAEHCVFAKQKCKRSAYIQLGDRFVKAGKSQLYKMNHWRESVLEQYSEYSHG
jgi:hypothetical protein